MDLIRTQRARFLHEIYTDLKKPLGKTERLELLQKVKEVIVTKEQDFPEFPEVKFWTIYDSSQNWLTNKIYLYIFFNS